MRGRWLLPGTLALLALAACRRAPPPAPPPTRPTPGPVDASAALPPSAAVAPVIPVVLAAELAEEDAEERDAGTDAAVETVRLEVRVAPVEAEVMWGARRLGVASRTQPLELVRPRHSGPVDLIVRAAGFVPYHTRLFTHRDDKVALELVRPSAAAGLVEWRAPRATPARKPDAKRVR